jgi:LCP family protein required for cell wall assembly
MTSSHRERPGTREPRAGSRQAAREAARRTGRRGGGGTGAGPPGPRGHGGKARGRKKFLLALAASLTVLVVGAAGAVYLKLNGNISSFDAKGLSHNRPPADDKGENVLLIGSDSRSGDNSDFAGGTGDIGRSDTTILLHVYADHRHAVGVSIPRDAMVTVPPCLLPGGKWSPTQNATMFNAAFSTGDTAKGNPACTQNTVERLTGLRVDHTMVVNFAGFAAMTSAVHGVQVCVPNDIYQDDVNPNQSDRGKLVFSKGLQTVSGTKALDYVRLRHGIGDGSDIGRMQRQQAFMSSLIKKVQGTGFSPSTLLPLANAATKSVTVDPGLNSASKLLSFAMSLKGIDLKNIQFITTPWKYSGSRVDLVHPDVDSLWATLKADHTLSGQSTGKTGASPKAPAAAGTAPASVDGTGISVSVYNGTTSGGLAAKAAQTLQGENFTVTGTATASSQDHATTLVEYGSAHQQGAEALAKLFPGARLTPTATSGINLVLGQDYANGGAAGGSQAPPALSSQEAKQARSAADNPCAKLTYGAGG